MEKSTQARPVSFALDCPGARSIAVAGTFNNWDCSRTLLRRVGDKGWQATVWLPPGRYEYRFVADGEWLSDPAALESVTNDFGTTNSIMVVG